jgi:hypothetical protein
MASALFDNRDRPSKPFSNSNDDFAIIIISPTRGRFGYKDGTIN